MTFGPKVFMRGKERMVMVWTSRHSFKIFSLDNGGKQFMPVENARMKDDE